MKMKRDQRLQKTISKITKKVNSSLFKVKQKIFTLNNRNQKRRKNFFKSKIRLNYKELEELIKNAEKESFPPSKSFVEINIEQVNRKKRPASYISINEYIYVKDEDTLKINLIQPEK